ncbi:hypothetical protein BGX34_007946 [Mortierella sp. NVP85]|nr:hypothetical protein BGX34_007946 [Mortierella sp. NVP85]
MPSADTDYSERSETNGPKVLDPSIRFEIVERLGYGSSGSLVFKARDRFENLKTVAIKKIPLSTLAGVSSDYRSHGAPTQSDVDYFVGSITGHSSEDNNHDNKYPNVCGTNPKVGFTTLNGGNDTAMQLDTALFSTIGKQSGNRDRAMEYLGCHQTNSELWLSLEFCSGGSVADLIRLSDGPLTESEIGWIMSQVLLGVAFLHSKNHVHGDIKASNILLMLDGHVKLGGSGSIMNHRTGAGERRRRRRSLTLNELPVSWLPPESISISSNPPGTGTITADVDARKKYGTGDSGTLHSSSSYSQWSPIASSETDIWALGVACIELFQGTAPKRGMPILTMFEESGQGRAGDDTFIQMHNEPSTELQDRIQRMVEFVDQCAYISSDRQLNDTVSISSPSSCSSPLMLSPISPSNITHTIEMNLEASIRPRLISGIRPRSDPTYDASSYFDEAGLPTSPPDPHRAAQTSGWKNQRISPSIVKQALMCEQAEYMIFRHSRSPSLATILESQMEDDTYSVIKDIGNGPRINLDSHRIDYRKERPNDSNHVGLGLLVA